MMSCYIVLIAFRSKYEIFKTNIFAVNVVITDFSNLLPAYSASYSFQSVERVEREYCWTERTATRRLGSYVSGPSASQTLPPGHLKTCIL